MSQQQATRTVFTPFSRDPNSRARTQTKASGDSNEKPRNRSKSKNKLPKSVRYDLENALVSLCDVWFEEIKPYLVRNNIKVHVHEEGGREEAAAGDRGCSHLDPGAASDHCRPPNASFVGCCSTQPTASRAPSRKPRVSLPSPMELRQYLSMQSPCRKCQDNSEPQRPKRRHRRRPYSQPPKTPPNNPVLRLCRTYNILPDSTKYKEKHENIVKTNRRPTSGIKFSKTHDLKKEHIPTPVTKITMKDKMTQTLLEPKLKTKPILKPCFTFGRRHATTSLFSMKNYEKNEESGLYELSPLFKDDLINIIVEKNEKRLEFLYKRHKDYPSSMYLTPSQTTTLRKTQQKKPWR